MLDFVYITPIGDCYTIDARLEISASAYNLYAARDAAMLYLTFWLGLWPAFLLVDSKKRKDFALRGVD